MLAVKYQSQPFGAMVPEDLELWADALMLKIHAITGWVVPEDTLFTVFTDQLQKKMIESYATVNPDELEYAFRLSGTTVKDWGKTMNLSLFDEVMMPYLAKRTELSKVEEQKAVAAPAAKEDTGDSAMKDWAKTVKAQVAAPDYDINFVPLMIYEWMEREAIIQPSKEQKKDFLQRAINYHQGELAKASDDMKDNTAMGKLTAFMRMKEQKLFTGDMAEDLRKLAKKMLLADFLKTWDAA